jgi:hypothetical protein
VALEIVGSVGPQRRKSSMYCSKVTPGSASLLNLMPVSGQKYEGHPETPGAGPSKLIFLSVCWHPQKQRVVGCQGGQVYRRRHPLNLKLSSIGHQGEYED